MTLREQVRYLFWDQAGWGRLSRGERWVAVYFALSLTAVGVLAEAPAWVLLAVAVNFLNAARMVSRIELHELTDGDGEEEYPSNESKHDNNDRPIGAPHTASSAA